MEAHFIVSLLCTDIYLLANASHTSISLLLLGFLLHEDTATWEDGNYSLPTTIGSYFIWDAIWQIQLKVSI